VPSALVLGYEMHVVKVIVESPRTAIVAPSAAALMAMAMRSVRAAHSTPATTSVERRLDLADGRTLHIARDGSVTFTVERTVS
jgi:hypothetical protein